MGRYEYKYILDPAVMPALRARFRPFVRPDSHATGAQGCVYTIRSLYFDTRSLRDYHEKLAGIECRKKLRLRVYNQRQAASVAYLEVKRKAGDVITKQRAPLLYRDAAALLERGDIDGYVIANDGVARAVENARSFVFCLNREGRIPSLLVAYEREPWVGKFDPAFRLTFDSGLRFAPFPGIGDLYREAGLLRADGNTLIMEVKFECRMPVWVRGLVDEFNLRRTSMSKYCSGVDVCLTGDACRALQREFSTRPFTAAFSRG